jgi:23S rRNA (adenine2503-C2)-methyltransferase
MKFEPAKRPLTGETLETLTSSLQEQGEKAFRATQILDWSIRSVHALGTT